MRRPEPPAEPDRPLFKERGYVIFKPAAYLLDGYYLNRETRDLRYFTSGFSFEQRVTENVSDIMRILAKRIHCDQARWRDIDLC